MFFLFDCDGLLVEEQFLRFELFDFVLDAVGAVEVLALYAEGFVGSQQFDHFGDFLLVEVFLVLEFAEALHYGGVAHYFAFAGLHDVRYYYVIIRFEIINQSSYLD